MPNTKYNIDTKIYVNQALPEDYRLVNTNKTITAYNLELTRLRTRFYNYFLFGNVDNSATIYDPNEIYYNGNLVKNNYSLYYCIAKRVTTPILITDTNFWINVSEYLVGVILKSSFRPNLIIFEKYLNDCFEIFYDRHPLIQPTTNKKIYIERNIYKQAQRAEYNYTLSILQNAEYNLTETGYEKNYPTIETIANFIDFTVFVPNTLKVPIDFNPLVKNILNKIIPLGSTYTITNY